MTFETIETERLLLQKITDEDYRKIFEQLPDQEIMHLLHITTLEQLETERAKQKGGYATFSRKLLIFQIIDRHTKENLGWCGYHTWYISHHRAEIGYVLYEDSSKSKGIMSEALKTILDYGFDQMQLNRIEAFVAPYNVPSLKLLEKFKFRKEGLLRGHYLYHGNYEDSLVFGLLKDERA